MRRVPKLSFGQGQLMLWILAGTLVAFGAMFLFFRVSGVTLNTPHQQVPHISVMQPRSQNPFSPSDSRYVIADVFDPSLMSLPSPRGFSRNMWRRKIEATNTVSSLGWDEQPAFLDTALPGQPPSLLQRQSVDIAVLATAEKTPASSEETNDGELSETVVSVNQSVFRVLSALQDRRTVSLPSLPIIESPVPLRPTQVRIGVGADGIVLYALLDRPCGDDAADAQALTLARQIRFEAEHDSSSTSLAWGVLRFLWATQAPAMTNVDPAVTSH